MFDQAFSYTMFMIKCKAFYILNREYIPETGQSPIKLACDFRLSDVSTKQIIKMGVPPFAVSSE